LEEIWTRALNTYIAAVAPSISPSKLNPHELAQQAIACADAVVVAYSIRFALVEGTGYMGVLGLQAQQQAGRPKE
jgi:hypothetical protein